MAAIQKQEQNAQGWFTWVYISDQESLMLITPYQMTESEALEVQTKHYDLHLYDAFPFEQVSLYDYKEILREAITFIKQTNPTLNQWNTYLAGLPWYDAVMVRWFLAVLARKLADRAELSLSDYTETEVLSRLKTYIINNPVRKLAKIFFGE